MMTHWLTTAILSLLSFGLWGYFSRLALNYIDARSALIFQTAGVLIIGIIALGMMSFKPAIEMKGAGFGLLTGLAYGVGCLFYLMAADRGKLVTVVTLTALYPLVTIILSTLFLQETISFKQTVGIALAIVAIVLLSN